MPYAAARGSVYRDSYALVVGLTEKLLVPAKGYKADGTDVIDRADAVWASVKAVALSGTVRGGGHTKADWGGG